MFRVAGSLLLRPKAAAKAAPAIPAIDASRFKTLSYKPGKKTSDLFPSSFLDSVADITGSKRATVGGKTAATGAPVNKGPKVRRVRAFSLATEADKNAYTKAVRRSTRTLTKADPKGEATRALSLLKLQRAKGMATAKTAAEVGKGKKGAATSSAKEDSYIAALLARATAAKKKLEGVSLRTRTHSSFYTDHAVRRRRATILVPKAPKALTSTAALRKKMTIEARARDERMNPVTITDNFFTGYEKRQFGRLCRATRLIRRPKHVAENTRRHALYKFWDRVAVGVVNGAAK